MSKWDMMTKLTEIKVTKALAKQEGPRVCWDARFLHAFFEFEPMQWLPRTTALLASATVATTCNQEFIKNFSRGC